MERQQHPAYPPQPPTKPIVQTVSSIRSNISPQEQIQRALARAKEIQHEEELSSDLTLEELLQGLSSSHDMSRKSAAELTNEVKAIGTEMALLPKEDKEIAAEELIEVGKHPNV